MEVQQTKPFPNFRKQSGAFASVQTAAACAAEPQEESISLLHELKGLVASLKTSQTQKGSTQGPPVSSRS